MEMDSQSDVASMVVPRAQVSHGELPPTGCVVLILQIWRARLSQLAQDGG